MKKESPAVRKNRAKKVIAALRKNHPVAKTALTFEDPFQLLVATILSAQCTDTRVNMVTPGLFRKYPTAEELARVPQEELELEIKSTGFFRNKARNIIGASQAIVNKHSGKVPQTMEELVGLPGVGRKTANCVLGGAFGVNAGVVVDTHVERLSQRMGFSKEKTAEKIERDLMEIVPQKDWYDLSNLLILHGRNVCLARKPRCPECEIRKVCPSAEVFVRKFWR